MRAELSPAEHADHLARRKELWGQRNTGQGLASIKGPGQPKGFAAETAAATGMSKSAVNLALSCAEAIPQNVRDQIRGTDLDKGTYLDSLKGMAPDDQREKVNADLAEPKRR